MAQSIPQFNEVIPYMAWNRLEGRPRKKNFENVLKAEIHDPLWMLGRQWQMGEFIGTDTGTGIFARMQMDYTLINGIANHNSSTFQQYEQQAPLEPLVESIFHNWSIKERVLLGKKFLKILEKYVSNASSFNTYRNAFLDPVAGYIIDLVPPISTNTEAVIIKKSEVFSNQNLSNFQTGLDVVKQILDGGKLYMDIYTFTPTAAYNFLALKIPSLSGHQAATTSAITDYVAWVKKMYVLPDTPAAERWNQQSLSYRFSTSWPKNTSTTPASTDLRLPVNDYYQGHFDWHSFVQKPNITSNPSGGPHVKQLQLIMAQSGFKGMPSARWWEFEDGSVNFCKIDGNTSDLAQIIMTQFALVYQDDWFQVPITVPVGSYAEVRGIVVTDVFGIKTFVAHHSVTGYNNGFTKDDSWKRWRYLDIGIDGNVVNSSEPAGKFLLPPVSSRVMEGKALESVLFTRDEMSNMVWAIEKIVPDNLGRGTDGTAASNAYTEYLKKIKPPMEGTATNTDSDATLKYELSTANIPENWIPFIPARAVNTLRDIRLQRASMPRIINSFADISLIRPRTGIIRYGLNSMPIDPYFINEEEVPRAGAWVQTSHQRTRWFNGRIFHWVGRRKYTGRGEGSSGLIFDKIKDME